jgi:hypothetical protein
MPNNQTLRPEMESIETSSYEEKLKFVTEFIKINSPSAMFGYEFSNENILPEYRDKQVNLFNRVWDWLYLNGIIIKEHKNVYDTFKNDEKLCEMFLQHVLTIEYFK